MTAVSAGSLAKATGLFSHRAGRCTGAIVLRIKRMPQT
jgi:hypothetical protein